MAKTKSRSSAAQGPAPSEVYEPERRPKAGSSRTKARTEQSAEGHAPRAPSSQSIVPGRHERIAELAYYRAEQRGFAPGLELQDWLSAEQDLDMVY
jgi:hypothetical protein